MFPKTESSVNRSTPTMEHSIRFVHRGCPRSSVSGEKWSETVGKFRSQNDVYGLTAATQASICSVVIAPLTGNRL